MPEGLVDPREARPQERVRRRQAADAACPGHQLVAGDEPGHRDQAQSVARSVMSAYEEPPAGVVEGQSDQRLVDGVGRRCDGLADVVPLGGGNDTELRPRAEVWMLLDERTEAPDDGVDLERAV